MAAKSTDCASMALTKAWKLGSESVEVEDSAADATGVDEGVEDELDESGCCRMVAC